MYTVAIHVTVGCDIFVDLSIVLGIAVGMELLGLLFAYCINDKLSSRVLFFHRSDMSLDFEIFLIGFVGRISLNFATLVKNVLSHNTLLFQPFSGGYFLLLLDYHSFSLSALFFLREKVGFQLRMVYSISRHYSDLVSSHCLIRIFCLRWFGCLELVRSLDCLINYRFFEPL